MIDEAPYEPKRMSDTARRAARDGIERARRLLEQSPETPADTTVVDRSRVLARARPGIAATRHALNRTDRTRHDNDQRTER